MNDQNVATRKQLDPETAIHTPPQVSDYGVRAIKEMQANKHRSIALGIPVVDDYFAPLRPGQVCGIIAQTSNYKSGFLDAIEKQAALQLMRQGRKEVLVHISVEELVEEQAFRLLGAETGEDAGRLARGEVQDWDRLTAAAFRIADIPIYRIGSSLARADDMPELYLSNMYRALKYMQSELHIDNELTIGGIYVDYLQAFPLDPEHKAGGHSEEQRRLQVRSDVFRLFQMAAYFKCPVWVAVQAKQHLQGNPSEALQIPGVYDGEETSSIAQRFDRIISLWMPKQTHTPGTQIVVNNTSYRVSENMLWVKVAKQRGGLPAGAVFPCIINFKSNTILPMDNRH